LTNRTHAWLNLALRSSVLALALCVSYAAAPDEELDNVTGAGGIYTELAASAGRWLDAVRSADIEAMVEVALPEAKPHVREALGSSETVLSRLLLSGQHSVRRRFQNIDRPGLRLLRHPELTALGGGTTACFYDPKRPPSPMPHSAQMLPGPDSAKPLFCLLFVRDQGRWFASYDFANGPDD
jgi:hypothetical protein